MNPNFRVTLILRKSDRQQLKRMEAISRAGKTVILWSLANETPLTAALKEWDAEEKALDGKLQAA